MLLLKPEIKEAYFCRDSFTFYNDLTASIYRYRPKVIKKVSRVLFTPESDPEELGVEFPLSGNFYAWLLKGALRKSFKNES